MKVLSFLLLTFGSISFVVLVSSIVSLPSQLDGMFIYAQNIVNKTVAREMEIPGALFSHNPGNPIINDSKLRVETVFKGLQLPTTMAFLGPNDILVLEKGKGTVDRIVNGNLLAKPILKVNVASEVERGMLGIAISKNKNDKDHDHTYVFLYFTEKIGNKSNLNTVHNAITDGQSIVANRVYRYEFANDSLVNPKLLLDLPATP